VEIREREAKGWVINFFFFFEGVEINSKGKEKLGGVFLGWHWRGKVLLFLRVYSLGHFIFQRSCSFREVGWDFLPFFLSLFKRG